ncbi:hypothetical protein HMPREF0454_02833 [Hafnia alvei ATCC 51873]|uniref:Uncharacterized protein n=1 Tax=Hafnia alvei ATCC 51873 TaxID=1002364 RepID=G9Y8F0_HAFAL|nr:hypothetical protein HMPREF0454_02833 [Hafnia alvei ATCC 51873]
MAFFIPDYLRPAATAPMTGSFAFHLSIGSINDILCAHFIHNV